MTHAVENYPDSGSTGEQEDEREGEPEGVGHEWVKLSH